MRRGQASSVPSRRLELESSGNGDRSGSSCGSDAPEVCGIDVRVRGAPHRPVQRVDRVRADLEYPRLVDSDRLAQREIQAEARRACNTGNIRRKITRGSRLRVLEKNVSRLIIDRLIREPSRQRRVGTKVR